MKYSVLRLDKWEPLMETVHKELLTPMDLRSLAPRHADYKPKYDGDPRARDAASGHG